LRNSSHGVTQRVRRIARNGCEFCSCGNQSLSGGRKGFDAQLRVPRDNCFGAFRYGGRTYQDPFDMVLILAGAATVAFHQKTFFEFDVRCRS
jgi:hypothetical protein